MLHQKGYDIDKKQIEHKTIKAPGLYNIDIKLGHGIHARVQIEVEGE